MAALLPAASRGNRAGYHGMISATGPTLAGRAEISLEHGLDVRGEERSADHAADQLARDGGTVSPLRRRQSRPVLDSYGPPGEGPLYHPAAGSTMNLCSSVRLTIWSLSLRLTLAQVTSFPA